MYRKGSNFAHVFTLTGFPDETTVPVTWLAEATTSVEEEEHCSFVVISSKAGGGMPLGLSGGAFGVVGVGSLRASS